MARVIELERLLRLQLVVGFLGERDQSAWWDTGFLASASEAFLAPVFGRTTPLARYAGVKEAARRVHDERIGIGRAFHLFRLPETIEQGLFDALRDPSISDAVFACAGSRRSAEAALAEFSDIRSAAVEGPLRIGHLADIMNNHWIPVVAGAYRSALGSGVSCFPYFAET